MTHYVATDLPTAAVTARARLGGFNKDIKGFSIRRKPKNSRQADWCVKTHLFYPALCAALLSSLLSLALICSAILCSDLSLILFLL
jgi:hypothetical protein